MRMVSLRAVCLYALLFSLSAGQAWATQGQWGAFVYLFPKSSAPLEDSVLSSIAEEIADASSGFSNDFSPQKEKTDTVQFIRVTGYSLNGNPVSGSPAGLIRVESLNKKGLDGYVEAVTQAVQDYYRVKTRYAVTRQLNYTDEATLQRLKENAPKRAAGTDQPNVVVFPLSKTPAWWALTQEKRQNYFFANPAIFGKGHLGHNEVGFKYINRIYRKLYHSRFIDPEQDFMTYFEYADADAETFNALLSGLRDKTLNQEWNYVEEKPIVRGKRVATAAEMFKP